MSRKRFNIGLVGSVQNGKTTLVERLSGINTKRHSAEMKEGRTVKLGYANLLMWKCPMCSTVFTTGKKISKKECDDCNNPCTVEFELSLVDAPGHSAFIKTMIRGSSIMEAAIVVTDAKQIPHQHQTLEHLAILEILGVKQVLVVQNKCDLVTRDECAAHHAQLRIQFQGTIADNSPVIPICAQRGLNISVVVSQLFQLCTTLQSESESHQYPYNGFAIIRSFDINKPDTEVNDLKGGVLGGCLVGPRPMCVGDVIEIRPGLIKSDNTFIPLRTKILTVFSEQKSIQQCEMGGLFALGTNLDPTSTKSDRLVGNVAGIPEHLPPVIQENIIKVVYVSLDKEHKGSKLTPDNPYHFLWGNLVVKGTVTKTETKNVYHVKYEHPICSYTNKCIIYGKTTQGPTTMVGFGNKV